MAEKTRDQNAKQEHYDECKATLKGIEVASQALWEKEKPFEADAPVTADGKEKFFVTFPYPYMNGMLHLGHGFSMSKSEFAARYMRLKGRRVLWPFGLHVTGTPIAACAQKLTNEMAKYGNPPQFPDEVLHPEKVEQKPKETVPGQWKAKRGKVATGKPQWEIMKAMGLTTEEIPSFAETRHWLNHFPPKALEDCHAYGLHIDYRRSFITTSENPYYDRFIQWQFRQLKEAGYLKWGKRYSIYSPLDGQPCADHDRATGEGVQPQEYIVVKLVVIDAVNQEAFAPHKEIIGDKDIVLPGATLRCETVVGQTNCWVSPTVRYSAFEITNKAGKKQIWITTAKCARNMAYQGLDVNGKMDADPEPLFEVDGEKLIGCAVKAPHAPYDALYVLPMATITENKGTGVVMSVPSDSPDDFINLTQLRNKPDYRAKLNLKDEWVMPFSPIPIINIEGEEMGENSAEWSIKKAKVQGPKDSDKLEECKKEVYNAAFYKGVMIAGPFKGKPVAEAKVLMAKLMIEEDSAISYREPMKEVLSRSGDTCVVALCDQWYLEYGKDEWKDAVVEHLKGMECYFNGIRDGFRGTLEWLADWPCSRNFGLGTVLPFAKQDMIIDSLSDSTIYMAYYTCAQFFHAAADGSLNLDGTKPNKYGITPDMVSDKTWDFIFRGVGTAADTGLPEEIATSMRREFKYWYPVDLRVSGKDLIQNHLTMFLYNHAAVWPKESELWPRSIYCNGHVLVDNEKMSKAKGNFITLRDALAKYGADATRLAIADAGDSLDDANFVTTSAEGFVTKLANLVEVAKERFSKLDSYRTGEYNLFDQIFDNAINVMIGTADKFFAGMSFRSAMNTIFFESSKDESFYTLAVGATGPHRDIIKKYYEAITMLLAPFCPHTSEHLWSNVLGKSDSVMSAVLPEIVAPNLAMQLSGRVISDLIAEIRQQAQKVAKKRGPIAEAHVYVASEYLEWQKKGLEALRTIWEANNGSFPADTVKQIQATKADWLKGNMQEIMSFIAFTRDNVIRCGPEVLAPQPLVDDMTVLNTALSFIQSHSGVPSVVLHVTSDESIESHKVARSRARPAQPTVALPPEPKK